MSSDKAVEVIHTDFTIMTQPAKSWGGVRLGGVERWVGWMRKYTYSPSIARSFTGSCIFLVISVHVK